MKILVKALTAIPAPDFNLCLYLLAEHAVSLIDATHTQLEQHTQPYHDSISSLLKS